MINKVELENTLEALETLNEIAAKHSSLLCSLVEKNLDRLSYAEIDKLKRAILGHEARINLKIAMAADKKNQAENDAWHRRNGYD